MSPTGLSPERIQQAIAFHGHSCPGLAIGIRAAELALSELGPQAADEELVCVSETDMCAVDAIQFLTGCTLGKGNLILADHGKIAFSFWRRSNSKALRLLLLPRPEQDPEATELKRKQASVGLTKAEQERMAAKRAERTRQILAAEALDLFDLQPQTAPAPGKARLLASLDCERCGESTMESRTRRMLGQVLCIPCFEALDRR